MSGPGVGRSAHFAVFPVTDRVATVGGGSLEVGLCESTAQSVAQSPRAAVPSGRPVCPAAGTRGAGGAQAQVEGSLARCTGRGTSPHDAQLPGRGVLSTQFASPRRDGSAPRPTPSPGREGQVLRGGRGLGRLCETRPPVARHVWAVVPPCGPLHAFYWPMKPQLLAPQSVGRCVGKARSLLCLDASWSIGRASSLDP